MKILAPILLLSLVSCTTTEPIEYQLPEKLPYPERVIVDVQAECEGEVCKVDKSHLQSLVDIISNFNDEVERRVDAYNHSNLALSHCSFSNEKLNQAIQASETLRTRESIISGAKQLILGGVCAALLIGK